MSAPYPAYRPEQPNRLARLVYRLQQSPRFIRDWLISTAFGTQIPFAGRAGLRIRHLDHETCEILLRNRRKNQNHIGTLHAAAMTLAAESASGYLVGMNVPDNRVPVIKRLSVDFEKRTRGSILARASLTPDQIALMQTQEKKVKPWCQSRSQTKTTNSRFTAPCSGPGHPNGSLHECLNTLRRRPQPL